MTYTRKPTKTNEIYGKKRLGGRGGGGAKVNISI